MSNQRLIANKNIFAQDRNLVVTRVVGWAGWLLVVLPAMIVGLAFLHIHTAATGLSDVLNYYYASLDILQSTTLHDFIRATLIWAPLHPLGLAAIIKWASPEWTYFLSPVMTLLLSMGLGCVAWLAVRDAYAGLATSLISLVVLLFGFEQFSHYLLYPYRESLSLALISWSMTALLLAGRRQTGLRRGLIMMLAGFGYLLAVATREPSIFAYLGAIFFVMILPRGQSRKWTGDLPALGAALIFAGATYLFLKHHFGVATSTQFTGWRVMTQGQSWALWVSQYALYLRWIAGVLGPWTSATMALGFVVLLRRNAAVAGMLLFSFLSTLGLYATFVFLPRYALSSLVYLIPFAGVGLWAVVTFVDRLLAKHAAIHWRPAAVLLTVFLAGYCTWSATRLPPWGDVTIADVHAFRDSVKPFIEPDTRVLIDPRTRLLHEVIVMHLQARPLLYVPPMQTPEDYERSLFIAPANREALTTANVPMPAVSVEEALSYQMNVKPVLDARGQPLEFRLGAGSYTLNRLTPWEASSTTNYLAANHIIDGFLWLNWQGSDPSAVRTARLVDTEGNVIKSWPSFTGGRLVPLAADDWSRDWIGARLELSSSAIGPDQVLVDSESLANSRKFLFKDGRLPSVIDWVAPPMMVDPEGKWAAAFQRTGAFRLPVPVGMTREFFTINFEWEARYRESRKIEFQYTVGGAPPLSFTSRIDRLQFNHRVKVPALSEDGYLTVGVTADLPENIDNHFRLLSISYSAEEQNRSVSK